MDLAFAALAATMGLKPDARRKASRRSVPRRVIIGAGRYP